MSTADQDGSPVDWLTTRQVAQLTGVSQRAVNRAIQEGRLAAIRIGHNHLIRRSDALAWKPDLTKRRRPR